MKLTEVMFNNDKKYLEENNMSINISLDNYIKTSKITFSCKFNHETTYTRLSFRKKISTLKFSEKSICQKCDHSNVNQLKTLDIVVKEFSDLNITKIIPIKYTNCNNVIFKCITCNYEYKSILRDAKKGHGCPICAKQNRIQTCRDKYGCDFPGQYNVFKSQIKETNLKKYGCENPFQNKNIKEKIKQTCLEKYGSTSVMHNPIIFELNQKSRFKKKEYKFPSGRIDYIQGYENKCLDELMNKFMENDILTNPSSMPQIYYIYKGKKSRYYPDIFIKHLNTIIEVKSLYTFEAEEEKNEIKLITSAFQNFNVELWVYSKSNQLIITKYYINDDGYLIIE